MVRVFDYSINTLSSVSSQNSSERKARTRKTCTPHWVHPSSLGPLSHQLARLPSVAGPEDRERAEPSEARVREHEDTVSAEDSVRAKRGWKPLTVAYLGSLRPSEAKSLIASLTLRAPPPPLPSTKCRLF